MKKRVFVMYAGNHRHDGRVALWLPVEPGLQSILIENEASVYFKPPYVGTKGWIGIELASIDDETLLFHIRNAWELIEAKK